ncbi:MAG TPA: DNA gyrase inhibitor YacG [Pirellulales bacterium]|jgi:endogenous inhibitor of DNA gyrase (YacG/DUF329 family)|nr:DNA gyrase inhibitor YacG [Pirellulales bacterium]
MTQVRCPTCGKNFDPQASRFMPFCSPRCRQIDLGRWLNEDISIPVRDLSDEGSDRSDESEND